MSEGEPIPAFRSHPRVWEENLFVYPVLSRRARGLSVGVNLSPHQTCSMDCVYCQVDRTVPGPAEEVDLDRVREELTALLPLAVSGEIHRLGSFRSAPAALHRLADIAFSGDGEPTAFRGFHDACRIAVRAKEAAGVPGLPVRVLTNCTHLDREEVRDALAFLDDHQGEIWAKLDAGSPGYCQAVNRSKTPLAKILDNITSAARLRPVVIQALFPKLGDGEPPEAEIEAWLGNLSEIVASGGRLSLIQVHTVARPPAEPWVLPVSLETLERIAGLARERLGVPVEIFGP